MDIEDNGPGMDEEVRKRLFEPFYTTKGVDKGTGLGLSIAYFIVKEDHGGFLTVSSAPGQGACFTLKLPLA
jgi:signal transduction histidine kinase